MKRALAMGALCLLACAGSASRAAGTRCTGEARPPTEAASICQDLPTPAASDLQECTSRPEVVRYVAKLHDSLLAAVDCPASGRMPLRAEVRVRIRRDGSFENPCIVGLAQPLAAALLAAMRERGAAPAPTGDATCLVGAPIHLVFTVKPE